MSNPGVIQLSETRLDNGIRFCIEDNIGEAIHLHYGDELRMDLTVPEFLSMVNTADTCLEELLKHTGFRIKYFDPRFLNDISSWLIDLESVKFDKINLLSIEVDTKNILGFPVIRKLNKSRMVKALNGDSRELDTHRQENFYGENNRDRLSGVQKKVKAEGYPFDEKYIVLVNNQNIIRDGQHRAACLLNLEGDIEVPVIRLCFRNNKYNLNPYPWIDFLFKWNLRRVKNLIKKILKLTKRIARIIENRIYAVYDRNTFSSKN